MTEAGHEDRTLLESLWPSVLDDELAFSHAPEDPEKRAPPRGRTAAHGLIIGLLLSQLAPPDATETSDLQPGLTRHYFEL